MRPSALLTVGALFYAASCAESSDKADASGGLFDAGAEGSQDGGGSDGVDDASTDAARSAEGGDATCGTGPAPNAWSRGIMPNPVRSGLPNPASYTVRGSGNQVADNVTGLTWQRNVDARSLTWDDAKQYCACLTIDGIGGWRLPSRIELVSIADWTISNPSIDSNAFPGTPSESFWTSTILSSDSLLAYLVYFGNGHTSYAELGYTYHARCVREGGP